MSATAPKRPTPETCLGKEPSSPLCHEHVAGRLNAAPGGAWGRHELQAQRQRPAGGCAGTDLAPPLRG